MGRYRNASRGRKALSPFAKRVERKRKAWIFERLEDRLVFSVDLSNFQSYSFSNQTAEGAALTLADELRWAQAAAANGTTANFTTMSLPNDPLFSSQWHLLNTGQEVGNPDLQHLFGV